MKTTEQLFQEWIDVMSRRWKRLGSLAKENRIVRQDFGPVVVQFDETGIRVSPFNLNMKTVQGLRLLPYYEQVRQFVKKTVEGARHEAAKRDPMIFEEELRHDLAEAEFMGDREMTA